MMEACIWITPFFPHSKSSVFITAQTKKKGKHNLQKTKKKELETSFNTEHLMEIKERGANKVKQVSNVHGADRQAQLHADEHKNCGAMQDRYHNGAGAAGEPPLIWSCW
jgi:hypothetical protein